MNSEALLERFLALDIRKLMIIPMLMLIFGIGVVFVSYTSGTMPMSIDFKGGSMITVPLQGQSYEGIEKEVAQALNSNVRSRVVSDAFGNRELEIFIDKALSTEETEVVNKILSAKGFKKESIAADIIQPSLGTEFFREAIKALFFAFILMAITVFLRFRTPVPSFAVVLSAFSDIVVTLAVMSLLGIELSKGSLAALLLLIGYSVDTDILLTTRLLVKKREPVVERVKKSMKTGITMSLTTFSAMFVLFLVSSSKVLDDVALVIMIGMIVDMINTWIQNTGILLWYLGEW